jgi:CBS domain-containing protein
VRRGGSMEKATKTARHLLENKTLGTVSVKPEDSVLATLKVMAEHDIGAVVVMNGDTLAGILSERDCARKLDLLGRTAAGTLVRDIMTARVVFATPNNTVDQCLALMKDKRIRHLPVVDGGRVIGVLSIRDVLEELIAEEEQLIQQLQQDRLYFTETGGTY